MPGDTITIDGATGDVFAGAAAGVTQVVPEAAVLLGWARELGIGIEVAEATDESSPCAEPEGPAAEEVVMDERQDGASDGPGTSITAAEAIRVLVVKGYAGPDGLATALRCSQDAAADALDRLVADGLAELAAGSFRLTADGKSVGHECITEDTASWGVDNALAALDAFLGAGPPDEGHGHRLADARGGRQSRPSTTTATRPTTRTALARLGALHVDASAWLSPLVAGLPRLGAYGERLELAAAMAAAGDGKYVASPRVDSYHSIWFELHEDLILLAGRNRAEEVAAGRA